jgi:hypothetical protein
MRPINTDPMGANRDGDTASSGRGLSTETCTSTGLTTSVRRDGCRSVSARRLNETPVGVSVMRDRRGPG